MFPVAAAAGLFAGTDKVKLINTLGLWILIALIGYWVILRDDPNELNKQTVEQLIVAVDRFSEASTTLTEVASNQREWSRRLEDQIAKQNAILEQDYYELYKRYQYTDQDAISGIDDLYTQQLHEPTNSVSRGKLRGNEDGVGPFTVIQGAALIPPF